MIRSCKGIAALTLCLTLAGVAGADWCRDYNKCSKSSKTGGRYTKTPSKAGAPVAPPAGAAPANPQDQATGKAIAFDKDVLPIFAAKCASCHGNGKKRGGLDVRSLQAMLKGGDSGPAVTFGSLEKSPLWEAIETDRMPPGPRKLSAKEKSSVRDWILRGPKTAQTSRR